MRLLTENIYKLINTESYFRFKDLRNKVLESGWDRNYDEYNLDEIIEILKHDLKIIKTSIDKGIFDNLTRVRRQDFLNKLEGIRSFQISIIDQHSNHLPNLFNEVQSLNDLIRITRLDYELDRMPSYADKMEEFRSLNKRLRELVESFESIENESIGAQENINKTKDINVQSQKLLDEINDYEAQARNIVDEDLSRLKETSIQQSSVIDQRKEQVDNIAERLKQFNATVEKKESALKEVLLQSKTTIDEHTRLQELVGAQLGKINGISLFESFKARKEDLEKKLSWWFGGIIIFAVSLLIALVTIVVKYQSTDQPTWLYVVSRLTISSPLVFLLFFTVKEYSKNRALIEEYAFKSAMSLSLEAYRELLNKQKVEFDDAQLIKFIVDTTSKIFTSPRKMFSKYPHNDEYGLNLPVDKALDIVKEALTKKK